jgi:hypothetical protein
MVPEDESYITGKILEFQSENTPNGNDKKKTIAVFFEQGFLSIILLSS